MKQQIFFKEWENYRFIDRYIVPISDRNEIQKEIDALTQEVDRIANNTEFNTQKLLNGNKNGIGGEVVNKAVDESLGKFKVEFKNALTANQEITIDGETYTIQQGDIADLTGTFKPALEQKFTGYTFTIGTDKKSITIDQKVGEDREKMSISLDGKKIQAKTEKVGVAAKDEELSEGKANVQVGANSNQSMNIEIGDMRAKALNITDARGNSLSVLSAEDANKAITAFDAALNDVSSQRANLGAVQNRLEYTISNLDNTAENLTSAESTLRDVDMAKEMMEYSKNNILNQAAQAMISQANQQPQNVLQLLR